MIKQLLKDWRILLVILSVAFAIYLLGFNFSKGVIVVSINESSPLIDKIKVGETITWANEKTISTPDDLYSFENYTGTFRFVHSGTLDLVNIEKPGLGITVVQKPFTKLSLGLDFVGGTRVLLKPKENVSDALMQQIIATLETRINTFGLREAKFQQIKDVSGNNFAQIEMAGGSREEVENLLSTQGKFEGKIPKNISFDSNNTGVLRLGNNTYTVTLQNDGVVIQNKLLKVNDTYRLNNINFQLTNLTNKTATLTFLIFSGDDIKSVCIVEQPGICTSRLVPQNNGWSFEFQIVISQESAQRFADITNDMKVLTIPQTGEKFLESRIYIYLDQKLITDLGISADLKGKALTSPAITGFRLSRDDALTEKLRLQSILQSGALPTGLDIVRVDQISPSLGSEFIRSAIMSAVIAALAVSGVIFLRYRKAKILIPMMLWSMSELIITLGAAALIKWTIDLASIAGLITAIGTGTNDQIMIIDEILIGGGGEGKRLYTVKQRIKRAFFIVFGAAGTVIAAMLPLMFVGIGVMKGFAIITTLGILIGVIITRPAFGKVAEKVLEKDEIATQSSK